MSDRFGSDLGSARGTIAIGADLRGVDQAARALTQFEAKSAGVGTGLEAGFGKAGKAADGFGAKLKRNQQGIDDFALKAGAMGLAIGVGLGVAIDAASDTEEAISKVGVVFGENAAQIEAFAEGSARALGLSRREALALTGTLGNLFVSMGLGTGEAADLSSDLVTLSADLASFNNVAGGAPEVLEDLRSGLVGESEPLRKYGIIINETAVQQEALNLGLAETTEEITEQDKVMARYSLIMQQTATAQGDFARTSEGLANQTRIARAELDDAAATLGAVFLPMAADAAGVVADLAGGFNALSPELQSAAGTAIAAAGGLALLAAAGAKVISIGIDTANTWKRVAESFGGVRLAAGRAAIGLGAIGAIFAGAAIGQEITERWGQDIDAALLGAIDAVGWDAAADRLRANIEDAAATATLKPLALELQFDVEEAFGPQVGLPGVAKGIDDIVDALSFGQLDADLHEADDILTQVGLSFAQLDHFAADMGLTSEQLLRAIAPLLPMLDALGITFTEARTAALGEGIAVEAWLQQTYDAKVAADELAASKAGVTEATVDGTEATEDQTKSLEEQAAAAREASADQHALTEEIQRQANIEFLAGPDAAGLALPFTREAEDVGEATRQFAADVDAMSDAAIAAIDGVVDAAPGLDGVQEGFSEVGASAVEMALDLANADQLDLTASQRQALGLAEFLGDVETSLAKVEGEIANNADDMSMWSSRIGLVTDTLGLNTEELNRWLGMLQRGEVTQEQFNAAVQQGALGPMAELDALLASGALTQKEYNEAKEAGIFLIQRSAGALQDEAAEQAKLLPDLAEYVRLHDDAAGAVDNLSASQRGFLAAIKSDEGALYLQQLQVLAYLASIGQIEPEVVTQFIADASAASPVIAAMNQDLGLIPPEVETTLTVKDEATPAAREARERVEAEAAEPITFETRLDAVDFAASLDDLDGRVTAFVALDGSTVSITVATEAEALEFAAANADALDGREVLVHIRGEGDEEVRTTLAELQGADGRTVTVPVRTELSDADRAVLQFEGGNPVAPTVIPIDVDLSDEDRSILMFEGGNLGAGATAATVASTVVVDDAQARADVDAFVDYADTAFAEHHLLVLGVEDDLAIQTLQEFQAALGAFSIIPVEPRVLTVDDDQAILDLQTFQTVLEAFTIIPVPPRVLTVDSAQATLDLQTFADSLAAADFSTAVTVTAETDEAVTEIGAVGAALAILPAQGAIAAQALVAAFAGLVGVAGQLGAAGGRNFAYSFAAAIAQGAGLAYQAAYTVALNAYQGILNALQIGSPSRRAEYAADMVTLGFVRTLRRAEGDFAQAGFAAADAAASGFATRAGSALAIRSVLGGDRTAAAPATGAAVAGGVAVGTINVPITVTGSSDPEATARLVWRQANEAIGRALSGGVS